MKLYIPSMDFSLVINYRNHAGALVNEVLTFDGPLVAVGHATYEAEPTA